MNIILPNFSVILTDDEVVDLLFHICSLWQTERNIVHWCRPFKIQKAPIVPEEFLFDPIRLKRIYFYYGSQYAMQTAAETAMDVENRRRSDNVIVEFPDVTHKGAVAAFLAILSQFSKNDRKSVVILKKEEMYLNTISMYTPNIFEFKEGNLVRLVE
ncbi:unnamed protein product [Auanema sp. JU1783]|nr:unnamed protein product [Auanema sp. JU1783]